MYFFFHSSRRALSFLILGLLLRVGLISAADLYLDSDSKPCWAVESVELNSVQNLFVDRRDGRSSFQLYVETPGVVILDAAGIDLGSARPAVQLVERDCDHFRVGDAIPLESFLGRLVLKVNEPGLYQFSVAMGPNNRGQSYRLKTAFSKAVPILPHAGPTKEVKEWEDDDESLETNPASAKALSTSAWALKEVEEWEDDDESVEIDTPARRTRVRRGWFTKEVEEWEDDDESLEDETAAICRNPLDSSGEIRWTFDEPGILAVEAAGLDLMVTLEPFEPRSVVPKSKVFFGPSKEILAPVVAGSYRLRWTASEVICEPQFRFYPLCLSSGPDDQGEGPGCATHLELGSVVSGSVHADVANRQDWFSFILSTHAKVLLQTSGDVDTSAALFDADGRLLVTDDDSGKERNFQILAALCPGRYFLGLQGVGDSSGRYILETSTDLSGGGN